ncbi:MAG: hypothetical protein ACXAC0_08665 [Candidatus Thorarchaeota archaeon]
MSSILLVSNAQYFSGSYVLAGRMEVTIEEIIVGDIDPGNESVFPFLSFNLNFRTDSPTEGNVRLRYISGTAWLNDDLLSLTVLQRYINNDADQILHPGYNSNFALGNTINSDTDRSTILQADSTDTWNWYLRLTYGFFTFDEERSLIYRTLYFNWTGPTTII